MICSLYADLPAILNSIVERASQNLTVGKLLIQLNLDPNNITFEAVLHRLIDVILANITIANACALVGAGFYAATFLTVTMVPLRIFGIFSALFFMAYGLLGGAISTFLMYFLLLPINVIRLYQINKLIKKARVAAQGDLSMDWLKPFMDARAYKKGEVIFRKGQLADEMLLIVTGKFLVSELGVELPPGRLVGEIGFVTPGNKRTQSVECIEDGTVMTIGYDRLLEVYFEQPDFGYFFLRLTSDRLLQNISRLEGVIEQSKKKAQAVPAAKS
jgi:Cyclic nucleotide-binding domain